ncbi:MAG: hypothetical protein KC413_11470, partial [Anaerolineales bacterium]|nr:hypothetical protein [Anaerolineales bacterium]
GPLGTDYLYFRLDTVSGPSAPVGTGDGITQRLFALIDCNNNGSFTENNGSAGPTDLYVVYRPGSGADIVEIRNSAGIPLLISAAGTVDGEQPTGTNNVNEWRVQKQALASRGCTNAVSGALQFEFQTYTAAVLNDETDGAPGAINGWNSPTSVHLQDFSATSIGWGVPFGILAVLAVIFGTGLIIYRRQSMH